MKSNLWIFLILLSSVCLFSIVVVTDAQEETTVETLEPVSLTEASEKAKKVYTQLMHAVYLQSFDKNITNAKRITKAKLIYDMLVQQNPDSAFVWYKRGQLRYRMQDIRGAEDDTRKAINLNPSHIPATWQLAQILAHRASYLNGKNRKEALDTLKKVTKLDPDHLMAHHLLADLALSPQNPDYYTAETALKALTRIMPFEPTFHRQLGEIYQYYLEEPKLEEAIDAYKRAVKIKPDDMRTLRPLGYLYLKTGKLTESQQTFKSILDLAPQDVRGNLGLGLVLQEQVQRAIVSGNGKAESESVDIQALIRDAETHLGRAIFFALEIANRTENGRQRANYKKIVVDAQYALANVYLLFENFEKAEGMFEQLLGNDPEHIGALYGIASVYQTIGDFEQAETYLRKTLSMEPAHEYALNALGYLYAEQGTNLDEAEALIKRALKKSPTNGAYLDSLGWVFFKQGRFAEAVTTLESANQQAPDSVEILMHLGDAYLKNGELEKARNIWQQAQTIEPDNEELQERLK